MVPTIFNLKGITPITICHFIRIKVISFDLLMGGVRCGDNLERVQESHELAYHYAVDHSIDPIKDNYISLG